MNLSFLISNSPSPRASSVAAIGGYTVVDQDVVFTFKDIEKNLSPKNIRSEVRVSGGVKGSTLSLINHLSEYMSRTKTDRAFCKQAEGSPLARLFIANTKPHKAVLSSQP